jgi:hypothetical protein
MNEKTTGNFLKHAVVSVCNCYGYSYLPNPSTLRYEGQSCFFAAAAMTASVVMPNFSKQVL